MKSFRTKGELLIPPEALGGTEHFRVWFKDNHMHIATQIIAGGEVPEPGFWGMILHDIAIHVARTYKLAEKKGTIGIRQDSGAIPTEAQILERIEKVFLKEIANPTDVSSGAWGTEDEHEKTRPSSS